MESHAALFSNPVIWEDLPDPEVIRVGDKYYMSASSFMYSPGAPLLESTNLVDWEYIGHSVPSLDFGERFHLDGKHTGAYVKGVWASTMRYRPSNKLWYFYSPIQGTESTQVYTAKDPTGPWLRQTPIDKFYYDLGLLIDDDDTMYLAYGTKTICVAQMTPDGLQETKSMNVFTDEDGYLEGARMYKIQGQYYIWATRPCAGQFILKSSSGPFGPYECRLIVGEIKSPIPGSGYPHQGALIDTPDGRWFYMAFMDGYPAGRIPILAPATFDSAGWQVVDIENPAQGQPGRWKKEYPHPFPETALQKKPFFQDYVFDSHSSPTAGSVGHHGLPHRWEWNHCADDSKWRILDEEGGLCLDAANISHSLYMATNTLTHRVVGPRSMATFYLDASSLRSGDRAGVSLFRYDSAYIGLHCLADGGAELFMVDNLRMSPHNIPVGFTNGHPVALDLKIDANGTCQDSIALNRSQLTNLMLRIKADVRPAHSHGLEKEARVTSFEYSLNNGETFQQLGPDFVMMNDASGYVGYRFAVFNFATMALGGSLRVRRCVVEN